MWREGGPVGLVVNSNVNSKKQIPKETILGKMSRDILSQFLSRNLSWFQWSRTEMISKVVDRWWSLFLFVIRLCGVLFTEGDFFQPVVIFHPSASRIRIRMTITEIVS
jgi:hypothetical protein